MYAMKPSVTLWWDYLSGSSASDIAAGDFKVTFRTLCTTPVISIMALHGRSSFMAAWTPRVTDRPILLAGLVDYAIKMSVQPDG